MTTSNLDFNRALYKYMRAHGAEPRKELQTASTEKVISHFKNYFFDNLFSYSLEEINIQDLNKVKDIFIHKKSATVCDFYELDHGKIVAKNGKQVILSLADFEKTNVYQIKRVSNEHNEKSLFDNILSLTPKIGYLGIPLVAFGILSPLYANVFNSRLVHTNTSYTFWFITGFFLCFTIFEYLIKKYIKNKSFAQTQKNMSALSEYFFDLFKLSKANGISIKIRSVEQAANAIWENKPQLFIDLAFLSLYGFCVTLMLNYYSPILICYYLIIFIVMYYIRFSSYRDLLSTLKMSGEKTNFLYSFEQKRKELFFIDPLSAQSVFINKYSVDELNRYALDKQNHHWSELVRINSFTSMVVMYFACFLAIKDGALLMSSIIAVMIINSRLSSSLTSAIGRIYQIKVQKHHFFESGEALFKEMRANKGIAIKQINQITVKELTNEVLQRKGLKPLEYTFESGKVYAITGASGIGKTTLIKLLSCADISYNGEVYFNKISSKNISPQSLGKEISYHFANMDFLKTNLKGNFEFYGIVDLKKISEIVKFASPKFELDLEKFEMVDADQLGFSNGEKQKLLLAMTLAKMPSLIVLDESTSFLSSNDSVNTMQWIKKNHPDSIILFATHDQLITKIADERIHLQVNTERNKVVVKMS